MTSVSPLRSVRQFTASFLVLTIVSGITIGMNKVLVTLLALRLDADPWQIGLLISAESLSMMLMSLPAGILISRYGARSVYAVASIGAMILYPLVGGASSWYIAAALLFLAGVCIPYRVVSMSTSWLEKLPEIGTSRGGWYRGTLILGIGLLGPLLGNLSSDAVGIQKSYWVTSVFFAFMAFLGYFVLSAKRAEDRTLTVRSNLKALLSNLSNPIVRQVCLFDGVGGIVRGFFGTFAVVIAVRVFHWSEQQGIMVMVVEGAAYVSVLLFLGPLAFRLGEGRMYDIGHVSLIAALLILGLTRDGFGLFIGAVLHAAGQGFNQLVNISRIAHSGLDKGHVSGLQTMVGMGGGFLGAALGGILSKGFALQDVFLLWIPVWFVVCPGFRVFIVRLLGRINFMAAASRR